MLIAFNFTFERWTRRVEEAVDQEPNPDRAEVLAARTPSYALAGMITATLLIVLVMVVKPTF